jgi:hypothetical protein
MNKFIRLVELSNNCASPAFKPEKMREKKLSCLVIKTGSRFNITASELLSFSDGTTGSEHSRCAVIHLVHVGITAVVYQAARQVQTVAHFLRHF